MRLSDGLGWRAEGRSVPLRFISLLCWRTTFKKRKSAPIVSKLTSVQIFSFYASACSCFRFFCAVDSISLIRFS